ncbi:MAG: prephenate dehydratase [Alphaproteobacteria bacterium]
MADVMKAEGAAPENTIAFQGEAGANSHVACLEAYPDMVPLACRTFEDALGAVRDGRARLGMIPIENTIAGRVADIHHLLPGSGLYIVGEHFLAVHHQLLGVPGAALGNIKEVRSHVHALGQCRNVIAELGLVATVSVDTAGAARELSESKAQDQAAIAPELAAKVYGLDVLRANIEDAAHNTTRFVVMAAKPDDAEPEDGPCITSLIFKARNVPAALYKAMGGFATNGVNMTKLESYQIEGEFRATQFYADIEGHPRDEPVRLALEELNFFSSDVHVLGVYKAHPWRNR